MREGRDTGEGHVRTKYCVTGNKPKSYQPESGCYPRFHCGCNHPISSISPVLTSCIPAQAVCWEKPLQFAMTQGWDGSAGSAGDVKQRPALPWCRKIYLSVLILCKRDFPVPIPSSCTAGGRIPGQEPPALPGPAVAVSRAAAGL